MRKATLDERRARVEENKAMAELIVEENKTIMMDPSTMDAFTKVVGYDKDGNLSMKKTSA
jgi:hypothetical protein